VGAAAAGQGVNARLGSGLELVLEADESYGTIAQLAPALCALTNVEPDHLDHYGTFAALTDAFAALLERSGTRVVNADDPVAAELGARTGATTVGAARGADVVIGDVHLDRASSRFALHHAGATVPVRVGAPGTHNVHNAAVAATVALVRGVEPDLVGAALARFAGVPRRYEFRGEVSGATIVDDYAHLPGEVAATVAAARAGGFRRVVAVFQPHRYTRTQALAAAFAGAFDGADVVVVTDVYGAGERPIPGVTGRLVADAVAAAPHAPEVRYVKDRTALATAVLDLAQEDDLILTMGAGDLTTLADELRAVRT
jgi:UDP-N-acetylmuramate--alanine ligase